MDDHARDNFFGSLRDASRSQIEESRSLGFEQRCVETLLRQAGIVINKMLARQDAKAAFNAPVLSFQWFHHAYPAFPVQLRGSKLANTSGTRIGWTELFGRGFAKLPWVKEFMNFATIQGLDPLTVPCGLIFNAPHADPATMVIHNHLFNAFGVADAELRDDTHTRVIRPYGRDGLVFVLESFPSFLAQVGAAWVT